eukprot:12175359-Ditylum_brightwellii.AAC.1
MVWQVYKKGNLESTPAFETDAAPPGKDEEVCQYASYDSISNSRKTFESCPFLHLYNAVSDPVRDIEVCTQLG